MSRTRVSYPFVEELGPAPDPTEQTFAQSVREDLARLREGRPRVRLDVRPFPLPIGFETREAWPEPQASKSAGLVLVALVLGLIVLGLLLSGCTSAQVATAEADANKAASALHVGLVQVSAGLDAVNAHEATIEAVMAQAQPFLAQSQGLNGLALKIQEALTNGDLATARYYVDLAKTLTAPTTPQAPPAAGQ